MKAYTALLALASVANAHMIMKTPIPANNPNSSPLAGDGSDYPCKMPGGSGTLGGTVNQITAGKASTLSFTGGATHGGGSCQVSIAKGTTITKDMKFMVVHSIEGGCPADAEGNLSGDPNGSGATTYSFIIPERTDLPTGAYTVAWTWNNKIGNREFYMNCANVQLTNNMESATKRKRYEPRNMAVSKRAEAPLPDLFVANIGNGCTTAEGIDVKYPNPGLIVTYGSKAKLGDPTGNCGSVAAVGSGSNPSAGASSAVAVSNSVSPTSAAGSAQTSAPAGSQSSAFGGGQRTQSNGGVFATVTGAGSQSTAPVAASSTQAIESGGAATQAASSPVATAIASAASSAPAAAGTGSSAGTCEEGAWSCAADGKSFKRCASGSWSASISMAAGTSCVPGPSANFAMNASGTNAKRDMRSHISKRRHSLHGNILS